MVKLDFSIRCLPGAWGRPAPPRAK